MQRLYSMSNITLETKIAVFAADLPYFLPEDFAGLRDVLAKGESIVKGAVELSDSALKRYLLRQEGAEVLRRWRDIDRTIKWCDDQGVQILHPWHSDYPARLRGIERPPIFLSVWGDRPWLSRPGLSIVGAREPTQSALQWLEHHLPTAISDKCTYTISGGARGIDQKAHALSLRSGVSTVAFLPAGLAQPYPADFRNWFQSIRKAGGAIVSEFSPHTMIRKAHFERRNRMIAALGCGVFVVEAARRSGSMMTARLALEAGIAVCALPSSPLEPRASGTNDLLFDGASLIRDAEDLAGFVRLNS